MDDIPENALGQDVKRTEMVKGMEFLVVETEDEGEQYYAYLVDGEIVTETPLAEVYGQGNLTLGRTVATGQEVMIDDDGVHRDW